MTQLLYAHYHLGCALIRFDRPDGESMEGWAVAVNRMSLQQWEQLAGAAGYDSRKLAKLCGHSIRQLERDFHGSLGCAPQDWLNERRIKAAQILLLSGKQVKAVAFDLGFKQPSHFCRHFKIQIHLTPSQFVNQVQNESRVAHR